MRKLLLLLIIFVGCSTPETIIKPRVVEVIVPEIKDSISASYINISPVQLDTLQEVFDLLPDSARFEGVKEITTSKGDIVKVYLNYKPKTNTFTLDIPSFKVDTTIIDTNKITVKKETTTAEKFGYMFWGVLGVLCIACGLFVLYKYRTFGRG